MLKTYTPDGWSVPTIAAIAMQSKGAVRIGPFGSALKKHEYSESGVRVLGIDDVLPNRLVSEQRKYIPERKFRELAQYQVKAGDLLVTNMGTVGRACVVPDSLELSIISSHLIKVTLDPATAFPPYISWVLNSCPFVVGQIRAKCHGAIMAGFNSTLLKELRVPLPPLSEQRRIAAILDKADELRAKRLSALAQFDGVAQALFENLFGRVTAPTATRTVCLGDVLSFVTSGSRGWAEFYSATGSRFIRSLDVQMNRISDDDAVYVKAPDTAEARRTRVEVGDVLLTITGSRIGRVAPVSNACAGAYISQHVAILRPIPTKIVPVFLSFFLSLDAGGQQQIARVQYGQTKPGLNFEQIKRFRISLPSLALQNEFARRLAVLERLKLKQQQSLTGLNALFASVQHRAFAGAL
jgi:type I restriction enzyme S subunit